MLSDPSRFPSVRLGGDWGGFRVFVDHGIVGSFETRHGLVYVFRSHVRGLDLIQMDTRAIRWRREILRWTEHPRIACAGFGMR